MVSVSGSLVYVSSRPAAVTEVWVRAPEVRTSGTGVITAGNDSFSVKNGEVSFTVQPGPAILSLVSAGRTVDTIPILVAAEETQTLKQVVDAAHLVDDSTRSELEELAHQVAKDAASAAQSAVDAANSLAGKADKVHTHAIADVMNLQSALDGKAAATHSHTTAQVTGLDSALASKASTTQMNQAIATAIAALAPTGLKLVLAAKDDAAAAAADTAIASKGYQAVVVVPSTGNWFGTL